MNEMRHVGRCENCSSKKKQHLLLADMDDGMISVGAMYAKACKKCYDNTFGEGSFVVDWNANSAVDSIRRVRCAGDY